MSSDYTDKGELPQQYKATERDVIVGDRTNTRLANRLLMDLVVLHHYRESPVKPDYLVQLLEAGIEYHLPGSEQGRFLAGEGQFVKISGTSSTIATDDDAIHFVQELLDEQKEKAFHEIEKDDEKEDEPEDITADWDVKLVTTEDNETAGDLARNPGNERFQMILDKVTSEGVSLASSHASRAEAALKALSRTFFVSDKVKARFLIVDAKKASRKKKKDIALTQDQAAEFVLCCVFDKLVNKVFSASTALASLLPVADGTVELGQFATFAQPGTTPIENPSDYDVLFGRGGMTNNHPGNKRFRDLVSLHRPDYVRAVKIEKPNVARRIVAAIRGGNPPGQFMKRNPNDLMWYDVGNRHATEKTSQALREKSMAEKNGETKVESEGDVRKRLLEQAISEAKATRERLSKEGNLGSSCLDPDTFELLIPPQYMPSNAASAPSKVGKAAGAKDGKESGKTSKGIISLKVGDPNGGSQEPSENLGTLDEDGNILPTDNDILCGRGGLTNHHKGNKRFRDIVALHRPDYVNANKTNKPAVARLIVKAIRNSEPPGRFLKKNETTGKWHDIGDKRASEKASQALREKPPEERAQTRDEVKTKGSKSENGEKKDGDPEETTVATMETKRGKRKASDISIESTLRKKQKDDDETPAVEAVSV